MREVTVTAALAHCANSVNGRATRRASQSPRECAAASAAGGSCTAAASRYSRRRVHRRACMQLVRDQRIEISLSPSAASPPTTEVILSREQRAHSRLSWAERLARNGRVPTADQVTIKLFGIPAGFATSLGLATVSHGLANRCIRSSRTSWLLRRSHIPSFPRWFSLLPLCCPFCSPSPLVWPDLPDFPSGSAWLSLTDQRLALPQARCASRG